MSLEEIRERVVDAPRPEYANIYVKPHTKCARRETYGGSYVGRLGDVRRCEHGKVQVLTEPERGGGLAGPGMWFWATLHPFWDFGHYRRTVKAMA